MPVLKLDLNRIKTRRDQLGISLQEMSDALGLKSPSSYYKYEKGEYKFNAEQLPVVIEKLELNMNEIFFDPSVAKIANG